MKNITLNITGMHCKSCSKLIGMELEDKVSSMSIDSISGKAEIEFDEKNIKESEIIKTIEKLGYKVSK